MAHLGWALSCLGGQTKRRRPGGAEAEATPSPTILVAMPRSHQIPNPPGPYRPCPHLRPVICSGGYPIQDKAVRKLRVQEMKDGDSRAAAGSSVLAGSPALSPGHRAALREPTSRLWRHLSKMLCSRLMAKPSSCRYPSDNEWGAELFE